MRKHKIRIFLLQQLATIGIIPEKKIVRPTIGISTDNSIRHEDMVEARGQSVRHDDKA